MKEKVQNQRIATESTVMKLLVDKHVVTRVVILRGEN